MTTKAQEGSPPRPNSGEPELERRRRVPPPYGSPELGAGGRLLLTMLSGLLLAGCAASIWTGADWPGSGLFHFCLCSHSKTNGRRSRMGSRWVFFISASWRTGSGVFAGHIIGPALSVVGWALVTAYQSLYLGVWALGAQWLAKRGIWAFRLGVPALWAIIEWWRQSGALGLGWGDLAYTQHSALLILQVTKLTGIWGLAFLIVLVNLALAELFRAGDFTEGDVHGAEPPCFKRANPRLRGQRVFDMFRAHEGGGLLF